MNSTNRAAPPVYLDALLADFASGDIGRFNHLGHWDSVTPTSLAGAQQRMNDVLVGLAEIRSGMSLLDAGCGFGGSLESIDAEFDDMRLVGLDIDHRQLSTCASITPALGNSLEWVRGDACEMPFAEGSFDRVLSIEAMWHFPSRERFLAELARVIRDDGVAVVVDILIRQGAAGSLEMDDEQLVETLREGFAPWPEPFTPLEQLLAVGDASGLTCTSTVDATQATKPTYQDHGDAHRRPGAASFSDSHAVRTFVELHRRDQLQIVYVCWRRRPR